MTEKYVTQVIVELDNVRKAYGPLNVLKGVSLSVERGTFTTVVGKSGSGKSTLLALISGLERPSSGRMVVNGEDLSSANDDRLAQLRQQTIGIVFQGFHLIPSLTALENVLLPLAANGKPLTAQTRQKARDLLGRVGMAERTGHRPKALSGGEQQRVAIARALITDPALLLADEPTGNLDETTGQDVLNLLLGTCRDHGTTLLMVTHDSDISARADATIAIKDGRVDNA